MAEKRDKGLTHFLEPFIDSKALWNNVLRAINERTKSGTLFLFMCGDKEVEVWLTQKVGES